MKERADVRLVKDGLADSRVKAQALIMSGKVYMNEVRVEKPSLLVDEDKTLSLHGDMDAFASRGGKKLEKALQSFDVDVCGKIAMDVGASTGGFTDVLLRNGAKHVYSIDVGYGQLDWKLRNDDRVTVMERTNARNLTADMFANQPQLAVMDVSFISIRLILPVLTSILTRDSDIITLIKPQFEVGKGKVGKNGVVRAEEDHLKVLLEIGASAASLSWHVEQMTYSPIKGPAGNIEFLAHLKPGYKDEIDAEYCAAVVSEAHSCL